MTSQNIDTLAVLISIRTYLNQAVNNLFRCRILSIRGHPSRCSGPPRETQCLMGLSLLPGDELDINIPLKTAQIKIHFIRTIGEKPIYSSI